MLNKKRSPYTINDVREQLFLSIKPTEENDERLSSAYSSLKDGYLDLKTKHIFLKETNKELTEKITQLQNRIDAFLDPEEDVRAVYINNLEKFLISKGLMKNLEKIIKTNSETVTEKTHKKVLKERDYYLTKYLELREEIKSIYTNRLQNQISEAELL